MKESPLFTKSYQFLLWVMQKTQKFPKSQRFVLASRLNALVLNFYDLIIETTKTKEKESRLTVIISLETICSLPAKEEKDCPSGI
jgi:hypothetical protein